MEGYRCSQACSIRELDLQKAAFNGREKSIDGDLVGICAFKSTPRGVTVNRTLPVRSIAPCHTQLPSPPCDPLSLSEWPPSNAERIEEQRATTLPTPLANTV
eukprot:scaffold626_cov337-Pavlova_lutheri.AAC.40